MPVKNALQLVTVEHLPFLRHDIHSHNFLFGHKGLGVGLELFAEPVLAVLLATFLLGEAVSAPQVIGMLLVVSGIILLNVANMKRSQISNVI